MPDFLPLGKIVAPHGVRGDVKVQLWMDDPEFVPTLTAVYLNADVPRLIKLRKARLGSKGQAIFELEGVNSREAAEALRETQVLIERDWAPTLEQDEYYVQDLLGLEVVTTDGERLGRLADVIFTGAESNEVYVVRGGRRGEILLPAIADVIQQVDLENERIVVTLLEGLIE
jgi:16S rRNA processing protein RimM